MTATAGRTRISTWVATCSSTSAQISAHCVNRSPALGGAIAREKARRLGRRAASPAISLARSAAVGCLGLRRLSAVGPGAGTCHTGQAGRRLAPGSGATANTHPRHLRVATARGGFEASGSRQRPRHRSHRPQRRSSVSSIAGVTLPPRCPKGFTPGAIASGSPPAAAPRPVKHGVILAKWPSSPCPL